jgi:hypothetical protein
MYEWIMNLDPLAQGLFGLINFALATWVLKRIKHDVLRRAVELFPHIVAEVYQVYVKALKLARPDGLTDAEKKAAMKMALDKFKAILFMPKLWAWLFGGEGKFDDVLTTIAEGSLNLVKAANRPSEIYTGNPPLKASAPAEAPPS